MKKREKRRDRTWRYARRAQQEHLRVGHFGTTWGGWDRGCECELGELSTWHFAKRNGCGCGCRRRTYGNPKVVPAGCGRGLRYTGKYRLAVRDRIAWRREAYQWQVGVLE